MKKALAVALIFFSVACGDSEQKLSHADSARMADSSRAAADAAAQLNKLLDSAGKEVRLMGDTLEMKREK